MAKHIDDGDVPGADTVRTFAVSEQEYSGC